MRRGTRVENQAILLGDAETFDVFKFPVREGDISNALKKPDQLVITESFAKKWFGKEPALGETVTITVKGEKRPFVIAAVLYDLPPNTMFDFEAIALLNPNDIPNSDDVFKNWGRFGPFCFAKLNSLTTY